MFEVPTTFAQLRECNFPLVVPFTHLLYLLDSLLPSAERFFTATAETTNAAEASDQLRNNLGWRATTEDRVMPTLTQSATNRATSLRSSKSIVEYEHFERVMWPRMSKGTKGAWREST